jgi:hypothetical protein
MIGAQAIAQTDGDHMPADKTAVAGATLDTLGADGTEEIILEETMKVSTPTDLILGVTAECSILTALTTNNDNQSADSTGTVEIWLEIDGKEVPVQTSKPDDGDVVFCNRTYQRTVTDQEDPTDGVDEESDYINTRSANAFNWVAFNVGNDYDDPANGNNIVHVVVKARYTAETSCPTFGCQAKAFVGNRTLVIEPVKASNTETSEPADPAPTPAPAPGVLPL